MISRKRVLRVVAVLSVALAAGHLVETMKATAALTGIVAAAATPGVPGTSGLPDLSGITSVAATNPATAAGSCTPSLALAAAAGAMIDLVLAAPCHPGQRVVIRHSGLSFATRIGPDGRLSLRLPALAADALVAAYFEGSEIALGKIAVPEMASVTRFAVQATAPLQIDLRAVEGDMVYAASGDHDPKGGTGRMLALGNAAVAQPILAQIYTFPGSDPSAATLTAELRITAETCSRTFPVETLLSQGGAVQLTTLTVAVPVCGTSGDILVLKNLVPDPKLAVQN